MNLSKSKYCNGIQCKKMLWLSKNRPDIKIEESNDSIMDNGNEVHEVAKNLLGNHTNIEFNEDLKIMIDDTTKALKNENIVITEASFNYNNNFCSVDILRKNKDKYEIYEVKGSTRLKDVFVDDISYQYYILKNLGLDVVKCFVVYLNNSYIKKGDLNLDELFIKEDVTDIAISKLKEVEDNINDINKFMEEKEEPISDLDNKCFSPYECPYFNYCKSNLPKNNIFDIRMMYKKDKIKLYKKGVLSFEDALNEDIKDIFKMQIRHELYELDDEIDINEIKKFMKQLSYPLYFLDFETFQSPIPIFDNSFCYQQIPFQYSLHYIEKENGKLNHKEFLASAGIDPRRDLALSLVRDIPLNVTTLAYNMKFEKSVIKELANIFPDLSNHLMNIHDNIKDLMIPFYNRQYYNKDMKGSYSIKYVLPALFKDDASLNYHNLDLIQNGVDAMSAYSKLSNYSPKEQEYIRERLLRYCELDTYAMVKIYEKLRKIIKQK